MESAEGQPQGSESNVQETPGHAAGEIPLFPLDLVLFPTIPRSLHIFEERYKEMVNLCVRESRPFGIVLTADNDEGDNENVMRICAIGCTARIARVERLPDGRMNIEVVGERRFRILDTHDQFSYAVGLTEPVEDIPAQEAVVVPLAGEVGKLLREFLCRSLTRLGNCDHPPEFELPEDPVDLSYLTAAALPIENEEKQTLLSADDTADRLIAERELLRREVTRLRRAEESRQVEWHRIDMATLADLICQN